MNVIFFGTSDFAVCALKKLKENFNVLCVITQPDKPQGRGQKTNASPVKQCALELGLEILQPENLKDESFLNYIKNLNPDIGVVVSYGKFLPEILTKIPKYGMINIHPSLIPLYRGAAPINLALKNGDSVTGISIIKVANEMDAGDVFAQISETIKESDDADSLADTLSLKGAELMAKVMHDIKNGCSKSYVQDISKVSYAHKIKKEDCFIDWKKSTKEILNFIRSFYSDFCACTRYNGKVLKIYKSISVEFSSVEIAPGVIVGTIKNKGIVVKTGDGFLLLEEVQPENGKRMPAQAFLCGVGAECVGKRLG